ncbi:MULTISPECIES: NAD-dependent formate dehydrogenase [unclassified Saccharopolyspora]|uniref:NAD-dependent formate dehydrogenase n=1 Tax=unclassified Saccharopolyspora TaxID=2646250 RepID=UPI001CD5FABB|nr:MULTISPECIES: NAD-dependent formate dehydrogenase [unclassified Saccharopolyspora]MCA1186304.1 NAD-dependent formate dehydrogenase [Saccharopolyspora sp. 6T]MCA1192177.1 NAD-dependent formate dehydrogenase [Saccharopolyspora sp. 6V]MCA1225800.1 NAD-dependent formate dehydrogenase [Saccharopolyspora sp. 6M]MCA1280001.1 NAD-dependent formate dehydrogenase [Saccharopolyspora sp. 7B]
MKIVAVLYPGPTEQHVDHSGLEVLGSTEGALGLRKQLESEGHEYVVLSDRDEALREHLPDADVFITTPFWPTYLSGDDLRRAPRLKLVLTAGVGSDHVDSDTAAELGITVAEVTGSNVVSVAEHAVMQLLTLVRNYIPAYQQVVDGRWDIADIAARSHDIEDKTVGIIGMGQIGQRIALRLKGFDVRMLYNTRHRRSSTEEAVFGARFKHLDDLVAQSDAIVLSCPLTSETKGMFGEERLRSMRPGAWLVNIARGQIVDTDALVRVLEDGHLGGYAGDVWYPQPAPADHPWRSMPGHALTPHVSGTSLEAQQRYAAGVRDSVRRFLAGEPIQDDYVVA